MIVKVEDGRLLRVGDVARVELGAQAYNWYVQLNGKPSIGLGVYQLPGANALSTCGRDPVSDGGAGNARFPEGMEYHIAYDSTRAIEASIAEVVETLFIAMILVIFTVYIFLQDFRTTVIPAVTIPVSLLGTFAVMMALGLSINTLTLFGLVLAIGIVVDDAIVVVENTMRLIDEEGSPCEGGHRQGHGAGDRAGHRDHARVACGVRPHRHDGRYHRPAIFTIRDDHRDCDRLLIDQRAHTEPRALWNVAPADSQNAGAVLHVVQRQL